MMRAIEEVKRLAKDARFTATFTPDLNKNYLHKATAVFLFKRVFGHGRACCVRWRR
jgi:hypothetical protein